MMDDANAISNVWDLPQERIDIKPYVPLYSLDADEHAMLEDWLTGPQVEIYYDLDDERDYAVHYQRGSRVCVARISDCVTINGIRWHLQPGKNVIPKPVYEFLMQCPEQRHRLSAPQAGQGVNLGWFRARH